MVVIEQKHHEEKLAAERYEAGMYKCLYDLWEKRASEYQGVIGDLLRVLADIRDESKDPTVALLARDAVLAVTNGDRA